jgi:zinc transporter
MQNQVPAEGLICAYVFDGKGGARPLTLAEATNWTREDGFLWVHLDWNAEQSNHWIHNNVAETEVAETLLASDTRPRAVSYDDQLLITLRGVNLNPEADPDDMVALRAWIGPDRAITTRHRRIMAVNDVREQLDSGNGPNGPGDFITFIADRLVDRMIPILNGLNDEVDDLEDAILDGDASAKHIQSATGKFRQRLNNVRREAIALRRYLAPQREALTRLEIDGKSWLTARHSVLIREASDHVTRYIEDLDAIRDRGAVIQDELRNRMSENMNRTMYVLTVFAAILLPLSFITGLLGINVDGMPGAKDTPVAFWLVVGALTVFGIVQVWLFRRLKWI